MKKASHLLLASCIILLIAGLAHSQEFDFKKSIKVSSDAWAWISPDTVRINARIKKQAASYTEAISEIKKSQNTLEQAIKQTLNSSAHFRHLGDSFNGNANLNTKPSPAEVSRDIGISIPANSNIEEVIDLILSQGFSEIKNIQFSVKDKTLAIKEAIREATIKAKDKAQLLSEALNVSLGSILNVDVIEEPQNKTARLMKLKGQKNSWNKDVEIRVFITITYAILE
jgi:uncharacterized protein YggE